MARKVQTLNCADYVQNLKIKTAGALILSPYTQVLTSLTYERPSKLSYKVRSWARFDTNSFDGMQLVSGLFVQNISKTCSSCTFKVYAVSVDGLWNDTLVATLPGTTITGKKFTATLTATALAPIDLTGEITFKVEVDLLRVTTTYKDFFYINDIGMFADVFNLRKAVAFLELTKQDD